MDNEKFIILKQIEEHPKTRTMIYEKLKGKINWGKITTILQYLKRKEMLIYDENQYPGIWKITNLGKEEIKHWEKEGVPGELF